MNKKILTMVELVANEKGLNSEEILHAVEIALAQATEKYSEITMNVRVSIDRTSGEFKTFRQRLVVAEVTDEFDMTVEISLADAHKINPALQVGEILEEPVPSMEFGRIAAQLVKNVIYKVVMKAELENMAKKYASHIGEMFRGTVKNIYPHRVMIGLGDAEAELLRENMLPRENLIMNQSIRVAIEGVNQTERGPVISVTRTSPELLRELFRVEVPEIADQLIQIKAVARDPGNRSKIAVASHDKRIDPVGSCIGIRGARVQLVSNDLNGERIDVVLFHEDPAEFVVRALAPAQVKGVVVNEHEGSMNITVAEDMLALAIGKGGQNVRLASELTGWTLNVMSEDEYESNRHLEVNELSAMFVTKLNIDEATATLLVEEGFMSLDDVAYAVMDEMLEIFDEATAESLQQRAKDALLAEMLAGPVVSEVSEELMLLPFMTESLAVKLAQASSLGGGHVDVLTIEDLADLNVDELLEVDASLDRVTAGELIMAARGAAWELSGDE